MDVENELRMRMPPAQGPGALSINFAWSGIVKALLDLVAEQGKQILIDKKSDITQAVLNIYGGIEAVDWPLIDGMPEAAAKSAVRNLLATGVPSLIDSLIESL